VKLRAFVADRRSRNKLLGRAPGARIARGVEIRSPDRLELGSGVVIDSGVMLHCGGMDWSPPDGGISIGARSYIGPNSVLFGAGGIELGEAVQVSPGVVITSHQHTFERADVDIRDQPIEFAKVVVERDVWIGANATILPGVRIGAGAIVGAGAVVTADLPPRVVALGVPARVRRER
jgi:serine acetyltransferase